MNQSDVLDKFPTIVKEQLKRRGITFPYGTCYQYEPIKAYRAVIRREDDFSEFCLNDVQSYFQLGKELKNRYKGIGNKEKDIKDDPCYYGVSFNKDRRIIERQMKFPNPNKKMASGFVIDINGPEFTKGTHVCWWLYENPDLTGFKIEE